MTILGIAAGLTSAGLGIFVTCALAGVLLNFTSDHSGSWWACPAWMAGAIVVILPLFISTLYGGVLAAYYVSGIPS